MNGTTKLRNLAALLVGLVTVGCSTSGSTGDTADPSPGETAGDAVSSGVIPSGEESPTGSPATDGTADRVPAGWTADEINFDVDGTTVYGTFLHPADQAPVPAAVLIAGSGPTDRDGNSPAMPGSVDTLANLARELADSGVATLRYDKLGSGQTGLGAFADRPDDIGFSDFADQAGGALRFLAEQPGVDGEQLSVYGHSEGALFALQLAADPAAGDPELHAVGLLEPLALRYLDLITQQVTGQVTTQQDGGQLTDDQADQALDQLHTAVNQLRADGTVPDDLSFGLDTLFNAGTLQFLREADTVDPSALAAELPQSMPVLLSCSDADIQVACDDVEALAGAVSGKPELVRLSGVNHVLKQDPSGTPAGYGKDLPFSTELGTALAAFVGH